MKVVIILSIFIFYLLSRVVAKLRYVLGCWFELIDKFLYSTIFLVLKLFGLSIIRSLAT